MLSHDRAGSGPPVLLLHGLGSRRAAWGRVLAGLRTDHDVLAVDLPGFGATLDHVGWPTAHLVGHSLGGWVAFELARAGRAASVCALTPAGLWRRDNAVQARLLLRAARVGARAVRPLLGPATDRLPGVDDVRAFADAPAFTPTLHQLDHDRLAPLTDLAVPVTVLLGRLDPLVRPEHVRREALPAHTRWVVWTLGSHLPMAERPGDTERLVRQTIGSG